MNGSALNRDYLWMAGLYFYILHWPMFLRFSLLILYSIIIIKKEECGGMDNFTDWSSLRRENKLSLVNHFIQIVRMYMKLLWLLTYSELRGSSYIDLYLIFYSNWYLIWIWIVSYLTTWPCLFKDKVISVRFILWQFPIHFKHLR